MAISQRQAAALRDRFGDYPIVGLAMRYGRDCIEYAISKAMDYAGIDRVLFAPLYPQYSAATTASAKDELFSALARMRRQPAIRTLPPYYADPLYIGALKASIERQLRGSVAYEWAEAGLTVTMTVAPEYVALGERDDDLVGDPYHDQCQETAHLLGEQLSIPTDIAFQSRFGRAKWLEPATEDELRAERERE